MEISGRLVDGVQDSSVFSILARPWLINKVTCGPTTTLLDTSSTDVMVTVDICMIALLVTNIILFSPLILSELNMEDMANQMQDKLDRIEHKLYLYEILDEFANVSHIDKTLHDIKSFVNLDGSQAAYQNVTYLEQPLNLMKELLRTFKNKTSEANTLQGSSSIERLPIESYKFPDNDENPYDSVFAGFEADKDEIIDLSGFTKYDKLDFYHLPRSFPKT